MVIEYKKYVIVSVRLDEESGEYILLNEDNDILGKTKSLEKAQDMLGKCLTKMNG